jgi:photosystem II stability/assembly factor-like uncharacterized protein
MHGNRLHLALATALATMLAAQAALASTTLSSSRGHARRPQLAYADGVLHAVDFEEQDIVYYRSSDRGVTWSAPLRFGDGATDWNPVICAAHNFVFLAWWSDARARGFFEVFFTRSLNGGLSFEPVQMISADDRKSSYISSINSTADGSRVIVAYWDQRAVGSQPHSNIFVRTSNGFGAAGTWGPETLVNDANRILDFEHPIARFLANGWVSLMFQSNPLGYPQGGLGPTDIQHTLSPNGGQSFYREPSFVSDARPTVWAAKTYPNTIVDSSGTLHAAWFENLRGRNVFYSKSTNNGLIWTPPIQISNHLPFETLNSDFKPGRPALVVLNNRVEVYWARPEQNHIAGDAAGALMHAVSTNHGDTFEAATVFVGGVNSHPAAVTDGSSVYLVYTTDPGTGRMQLMYTPASATPVPLLDTVGFVLLMAGFTAVLRSSLRRQPVVAHRRVRAAVPLTLGLLVLLGPPGARAQETLAAQALTLEGGTVNDLHRASDGTLLAGTDGSGVYRSTDNGATWLASSTGLTDLYVTSLDGDGANLVLAGTAGGLYRSTDSGRTWRRQLHARINAIHLTPGNPSVCFAGTQSAGVLRSLDGGVTWSSPGISGLASLEINTIDVAGGRVWAGTNGMGVHVSTDNGATWQRRVSGLEAYADAPWVSRIRVDAQSPDTVYIGTLGDLAPAALSVTGGDVYVTTNAGASWRKQSAPEPFYGVAGLAFLSGRLFVGTNSIGLYASSGPPSSGQFSKLIRAVQVRDVVTDASGQNVWVGLRGGGVFRSSDGGATFVPSSHGLRALVVHDMAVSGQTILVAAAGGIQRSTDGGASFAWSNSGLGTGESLAVDMLAVNVSGGRAYASSLHDGFYVSSNAGGSWTRHDPPDPGNIRAIALGANPDLVVVGGYRGTLFRSQDAGQSWASFQVGVSKAFVSSIALDPGNTAQMLVCAYNERCAATSNGTAFSVVGQPTSVDYRVGFQQVLTLPSLNLQVAATTEGMMTRGLSYGASPAWARRLGGLSDIMFTSVVAQPGNPSKLVAAAYGGGLYVSNDGGMNWSKVNVVLRSTAIQKLAAYGGSVLVGMNGDGVYKLPWP